MLDDRFDALARQLSRSPSRRRVLQVVGGMVTVGSLAALDRADHAEAAPPKDCIPDFSDQVCTSNRVCCSRNCEGGKKGGLCLPKKKG